MEATLNPREVSEETGISYGRVVGDLVSGRLKGRQIGGRDGWYWTVKRRDLDAWLADARTRAEAAVERFIVPARIAEGARRWWQDAMRTAQAEAATLAEDFARRHRALLATAASGRAVEPKVSDAFGETMDALRGSLDRMAYLNAMYGSVVGPLEGEALALGKEAQRLASDAVARSTGRKPGRGSDRTRDASAVVDA